VHLGQLVDPKIKEHGGRTVKNTGDDLLAEFASVVNAVGCAVEVQRGMAERNASTPSEKRIEFRIGVTRGRERTYPHRSRSTTPALSASSRSSCREGAATDQLARRPPPLPRFFENCHLTPITISGTGLATFTFDSLTELHPALDRVYKLGINLPDAPLARFRAQTSHLPQTTEAERRSRRQCCKLGYDTRVIDRKQPGPAERPAGDPNLAARVRRGVMQPTAFDPALDPKSVVSQAAFYASVRTTKRGGSCQLRR
jgi:hypothetical protein